MTIAPVTALREVCGRLLAVDGAIVVQTAAALGVASSKSIVSIALSTNCTGLII
ncbi:MAG: hypothetical protein WBL95_07600 [Microcoleus sp.]